MDRKKAKRIIRAIAKREGKDENLVREEMKRAITSGYRKIVEDTSLTMEQQAEILVGNADISGVS